MYIYIYHHPTSTVAQWLGVAVLLGKNKPTNRSACLLTERLEFNCTASMLLNPGYLLTTLTGLVISHPLVLPVPYILYPAPCLFLAFFFLLFDRIPGC